MDSKEEKVDGCTVTLIVAVVMFFAAVTFLELYAGKGHAGGFRGTVSADWHHLKCNIKLCDEDGKCPVWSSKYSKCYMLDSAGVNELDMYVKLGCTSKEYEKRELCF